MRIGVVSAQVFICPPPGYSGLEMIAWQCAKELAVRGHKVALFAPEGSHCPGAVVIPTGKPGQWDERAAFVNTHQELLKADAIIDHSWSKFSYSLKMDGRFKGPVLGVCHAPVDTMYKTLPPVDKTCMVTISKDQAAALDGLFGAGKARHCWNGIDLDFYKPVSGMKRVKRMLFLARFSTIKGPDLALDACKAVEAGLDMVGDASITNEPELFKKCFDICAANPVMFRMVGGISRQECVWWFNRDHVLLHPNLRFREPFGLSPVEAQACGMPVLAFNNGAMRETVSHNETGWLVNTVAEFNAAVAASKNMLEADMIHYQARCREWASQFSIQNMAARYEFLCEEALNTGGW